MAPGKENAWLKASRSFYSGASGSPGYSPGTPSQTLFPQSNGSTAGGSQYSSLFGPSPSKTPRREGDEQPLQTGANGSMSTAPEPTASQATQSTMVISTESGETSPDGATTSLPGLTDSATTLSHQLKVLNERLDHLEHFVESGIKSTDEILAARFDSYGRYLEKGTLSEFFVSMGYTILAKAQNDAARGYNSTIDWSSAHDATPIMPLRSIRDNIPIPEFPETVGGLRNIDKQIRSQILWKLGIEAPADESLREKLFVILTGFVIKPGSA